MILIIFGIAPDKDSLALFPVDGPLRGWLCLITSIGTIGCGAAMLFVPKWWVRRYVDPVNQSVGPVIETTLRCVGAVFIAVGAYFGAACMTQ